MGLAAVVAAHIDQRRRRPCAGLAGGVLVGFFVGVLIACVPGLVNGLLISRLKVPPFIGTLGMFGVARGVAFLLAGGTTVPVSNSLLRRHRQRPHLRHSLLVIITARLLLGHALPAAARPGSASTTTPSAPTCRPRAAPASTSSSTSAASTCSRPPAPASRGVLYAARFNAGAAQAGEPLLLDCVAAVVIGGASLFGGSGTILGTVAGALVIAVIQYGLVFVNVEPFWQFIAVGVVIIISVLIDQAQRRFSGGRVDE